MGVKEGKDERDEGKHEREEGKNEWEEETVYREKMEYSNMQEICRKDKGKMKKR